MGTFAPLGGARHKVQRPIFQGYRIYLRKSRQSFSHLVPEKTISSYCRWEMGFPTHANSDNNVYIIVSERAVGPCNSMAEPDYAVLLQAQNSG